MQKTLRGIGIGLFLAGSIFTINQQFNEPFSQEDITTYKKEIKDLEIQLAEAKEQLTNLGASTSIDEAIKQDNEATSNSNKQDIAEQVAKEKIVHATILIYEGVTLYDVGKQAEDAGIMENGRELELYLSKPEYARSLQKGQFEIHSAMTLEQMAKILTGKKVE